MARRKISKTSGLPALTAKQMKFCEGILAGLSQSDAYRAAYDCAAMSNASIWCNASRLRADVKVALWLDAATTEVAKAHHCTLDDHLKELARLKSIAIRTGNVGAAVQAEQLRGKAAGHYVEQYADVTYDPVATLKELAQHDADMAQQLADANGITWPPDSKSKPHNAPASVH